MLICDLCLEVHALKEHLREGMEIVEGTSFLVETSDAGGTFYFQAARGALAPPTVKGLHGIRREDCQWDLSCLS
jgi:hypothetical protein